MLTGMPHGLSTKPHGVTRYDTFLSLSSLRVGPSFFFFFLSSNSGTLLFSIPEPTRLMLTTTGHALLHDFWSRSAYVVTEDVFALSWPLQRHLSSQSAHGAPYVIGDP